MTTAKHNLLALSISFVALLCYVLVNLQHYNVQYNIRYIMNLYSHSQWSIKGAVRSIDDEGLYQAAAYHTLTTGKIASINTEEPPAGKYLIMLSMLFFNNPYYVHPVLYLLSAILVFKIALKLSSPAYAWVALILFLTEPLIGLQASGSLLDLPQLFWLLLHIYLLQKFLEPEQAKPRSILWYGIGLGLTLGFFAATKFGIFTALILLGDTWILVVSKKMKTIPIIIATTLITYIAMFAPLFIQHRGDLSEWFKLEIHRINFSRQNLSGYIPGSGVVSIFTPWQLSGQAISAQLVREWNLLWLFSAMIILIAAWIYKNEIISITRQKITGIFQPAQPQQAWYQATPAEASASQLIGNYLVLVAFLFFVATALIPFGPRNLTNILPLGIIIFAYLLHQQKLRLFSMHRLVIPMAIVVSVFHLANLAYVITPPAQASAKTYAQWFSESLYLDLYHALSTSKELQRTDEEFWKQLLKLEKDMGVYHKSVEIKLNNSLTMPWDNLKQGTLTLTYDTPIGSYTHASPITFKRNFSRWEIVWNWNHILPNYRPTDVISLNQEIQSSCEVRTDNDQVAAQFKPWPVLYLIPNNLDSHPSREQITREISDLTGLSPSELSTHYRANKPDDAYTRIAQLTVEYSEVKLQELIERSGFQVREEIVWMINKDLTAQQREAAQTITQKYRLDQSPMNGTIVRKRRGHPDEVLLERNESSIQCLYTI